MKPNARISRDHLIRTWWLCAMFAAALPPSPIFGAGIGVVGVELTDNGDDDGFADTLETVGLRPTIHNTTQLDLQNVVLQLSTVAPEIACVSRPMIFVGDLAAGEIRRVGGTFVFTVGDVDRAVLGLGPFEPLSVSFRISVAGDHLGEPAVAPTVDLDLDLDVSGGSGPATFFEGFESGSLGTFTNQNLDAGRSDLNSADGYRCQYNDPDWIASNTYGTTAGTTCYFGASAQQADAVYWQVDGPGPEASWPGKGFGGLHSLYYGVELDPTLGHTTPTSVLEAAATGDPVNIGWGRVCEVDGLTACSSDSDCPVGDRCTMVLPELSIKHQIHLYFRRSSPNSLLDRAVVQAQLADDTGQPTGPWMKIAPYQNTYGSGSEGAFNNCSFDPVDDGNTEDDFFDPTDPMRRLGPSSTCHPERVFGFQGDTFDPFHPSRVGLGEGPGLEGETGLGTWVESRFDLSRFRGRRIRLRFLASALKIDTVENWEQIYVFNPIPEDDGWWIDDVTIDDTLAAPASTTIDTADNTFLPGLDDGDGDGTIDACDPCPALADATQLDSDGDGIGDLCDNCPTTNNPDQADSDLDGLGDWCDTCPNGDASDEDGDGVPCVTDQCPTTPNAERIDTDADGLGDACDPCPLDPGNDVDEDGLCLEADNCPQRFNPDQTAVVRVVVPQRLGEVTTWVFTPDSRRIVYVADQDVDEQFGIYSIPVTGGSSVRLGAAGPFLISPDGRSVLYVADEDAEGVFELFSVPIEGGPRVKLSGDLVTGGEVSSFTISPDGQTVLYIADQDVVTVDELFSIPVDGGTPVKLNDPMIPGGAILDVLIDDSGSTAVFRGDQDTNDVIELYSVPISGGAVTKLNGTLTAGGDVNGGGLFDASFAISSDGPTVVYLADQETDGRDELYSVPIGGGIPTRLHGELVSGTDVREFVVTPDDSNVIFNATSVVEGGGLFAAAIDGSLTQRLAQAATYYWVSPDSSRVVFHDASQLSSVPVAGGAPTVLDNQINPGYLGDLEISSDSSRVVYHEAYTDELRSVPTAGGAPVLLNDIARELPYYTRLDITPDSSTVLYVASDNAAPSLDNLYRVPITGGASMRVNDPLPFPQLGVIEFRIGPDGASVTYFANQYREDRKDLMAKAMDVDPDGDGLLLFCDSCPRSANPLQGDRDGDLVGDACDSCPWAWNEDQIDSDMDGAGDTCDCAPADPTARPPAEATDVMAAKPAAGTLRLLWSAAEAADAHSVSRAMISQLSTNQLGQCIEPALSQNSFDDPQTPPTGDGFAYLIQGVDTVCGGGTLGSGADDAERSNLDPEACP